MKDYMSKYLGPAIVTVAVLGTVVALTWHGEDAAKIGALLAIVGLFLDQRFKTADQNVKLDRIDENVNGKLDARIKDAVRTALIEHGVNPDLDSPNEPQ